MSKYQWQRYHFLTFYWTSKWRRYNFTSLLIEVLENAALDHFLSHENSLKKIVGKQEYIVKISCLNSHGQSTMHSRKYIIFRMLYNLLEHGFMPKFLFVVAMLCRIQHKTEKYPLLSTFLPTLSTLSDVIFFIVFIVNPGVVNDTYSISWILEHFILVIMDKQTELFMYTFQEKISLYNLFTSRHVNQMARR